MTAAKPLQIQAGDLVEATVASTRPRTIRVRVDRQPWPINHRSTTLTDGKDIVAVFTDSLRVVEETADSVITSECPRCGSESRPCFCPE